MTEDSWKDIGSHRLMFVMIIFSLLHIPQDQERGGGGVGRDTEDLKLLAANDFFFTLDTTLMVILCQFESKNLNSKFPLK